MSSPTASPLKSPIRPVQRFTDPMRQHDEVMADMEALLGLERKSRQRHKTPVRTRRTTAADPCDVLSQRMLSSGKSDLAMPTVKSCGERRVVARRKLIFLK